MTATNDNITPLKNDNAPTTLSVMLAVQASLMEAGVGKGGWNKDQGYAFRSIDDMLTAVSRSFVKHGLICMPEVKDEKVEVLTTAKGGRLFRTLVDVHYHFLTATSDDAYTIIVSGEAMDSSDKSLSKAMTMAYKTMLNQTFCIPLVGQSDPDAETPVTSQEELVSADQIVALKEALASERNIERFLSKVAKVSTLEEIPAASFKMCMAQILAAKGAKQ